MARNRYSRLTGAVIITTVVADPELIRRIVVSNADAAVQTVIVNDGELVLFTIHVGIAETKTVELDLTTVTNLRLTPSDADVTCLVVHN